jgi:hypothetical protein
MAMFEPWAPLPLDVVALQRAWNATASQVLEPVVWYGIDWASDPVCPRASFDAWCLRQRTDVARRLEARHQALERRLLIVEHEAGERRRHTESFRWATRYYRLEDLCFE